MNNYFKNKIVLVAIITLAIGLIIASSIGSFDPSTYSAEVESYAEEGRAQDLVTLFLGIPILLISYYFARRKSMVAVVILCGDLLYFFYSYITLSYGAHYNYLFLLYTVILALSVYLLIFTLSMFGNKVISEKIMFPEKVFLPAILYTTIMASIFYFIWLSELIPAFISRQVPLSITETGIINNPIHANDLCFVLPGMLISSFLMIRKNRIALFLSPVMLFFSFIISVAVFNMGLYKLIKGIETDLIITSIFGVSVLISFSIFVITIRRLKFLKNLS